MTTGIEWLFWRRTAKRVGAVRTSLLLELFDGHILNDWRLPLLRSKALCFVFVEVDAGKDFFIFISDCDAEVIVNSWTAFPFSSRGSGH